MESSCRFLIKKDTAPLDKNYTAKVKASIGNISIEKVFSVSLDYAKDADVWDIYTSKGLYAWRDYAMDINTDIKSDINVKLMADIIMPEPEDGQDGNWIPFGTLENYYLPFSGTFDGNGYSIKNLKISMPNKYGGFFASANGSTIKNLHIENCDIKGGEKVGAIVGDDYRSKIEGCSVSGYVEGGGIVGGIIGDASTSTVKGCCNSSNLKGTGDIGGIVGMVSGSSSVIACYNNGNIECSGSYSAGIVGYSMPGNITARIAITGCYSTGRFSGDGGIFGIAGGVTSIMQGDQKAEVKASFCYWDAKDGVPDSGAGTGAICEYVEKIESVDDWNTNVLNSLNTAIKDYGYKFVYNDTDRAKTPYVLSPCI